MRHTVPDAKTQQQQQQSFLASIQQQTTIVKDMQKSVLPSTSMLKHDDYQLIEPSQPFSPSMVKGQSSINNCIIQMNNGQYQIKQQSHPRIIVKDPVKTMSPLMFPTAATSMHQPIVTTINNSSIQSKDLNLTPHTS